MTASAAIKPAASSSSLGIKEYTDRIGALPFTGTADGLYILGQHVDQVDANETVRLWKLAQDKLDKPSENPGRDARALMRNHFGLEARELGIWEVRMTPLRDSIPPNHTERKGFRNTLTTWVAVQFYGGIETPLAATRRYKWIHIDEFLNECQVFKVPNYAEVLKLLDECLHKSPTH